HLFLGLDGGVNPFAFCSWTFHGDGLENSQVLVKSSSSNFWFGTLCIPHSIISIRIWRSDVRALTCIFIEITLFDSRGGSAATKEFVKLEKQSRDHGYVSFYVNLLSP
ncbi:517_t:CDS:1, partial [Funneliformis mosseae]